MEKTYICIHKNKNKMTYGIFINNVYIGMYVCENIQEMIEERLRIKRELKIKCEIIFARQ